MYNQKVKALVSKYERLQMVYDIGPVQKCIFEDFVEEVTKECASLVQLAIDNKVPTEHLSDLISKTFDDVNWELVLTAAKEEMEKNDKASKNRERRSFRSQSSD